MGCIQDCTAFEEKEGNELAIEHSEEKEKIPEQHLSEEFANENSFRSLNSLAFRPRGLLQFHRQDEGLTAPSGKIIQLNRRTNYRTAELFLRRYRDLHTINLQGEHSFDISIFNGQNENENHFVNDINEEIDEFPEEHYQHYEDLFSYVEDNEKKSEIIPQPEVKEEQKLDLFICKICYTNLVQIMLQPCGHPVCSFCASKLSECPFDRTEINKKQKILI